jgi:membrane protein
LNRLLETVDAWLWPARPLTNWYGRLPRTVLRFCIAIMRDLARGDLSLRAASLVYTTMLSLVPLLALSFSVLKGLGFHRQIEPLLANFFAPLGVQGQQITSRIIEFVDNVQGSVLAGLSLGLLLFTTISMANKVETSFNFVWHVRQTKNPIRRISEYLSLMLAGPLVATVAIGLIATISSTSLMEQLRNREPFGLIFSTAGEFVTYLIIISAFSFLYAFLPNTKVQLRSALVGGTFAGIAWVLSGYLFATFVGSSGQTQLIYSGFAAIIAAMLWLYLSWLVLLTGAQVAYYHQHPKALQRKGQADRPAVEAMAPIALGLMWLLGTEFRRAGRNTSRSALASRLNCSIESIGTVVDCLRAAGLIASTDEQQLFPARDPRTIAVGDILSAVRPPLVNWPGLEDSPLPALLESVAQRTADSLAGLTLADLLDATPRSDAAS